jgi:hypothetical protein
MRMRQHALRFFALSFLVHTRAKRVELPPGGRGEEMCEFTQRHILRDRRPGTAPLPRVAGLWGCAVRKILFCGLQYTARAPAREITGV